MRPEASVVEIWPGGGYWTQILGPYLRDKGVYTLALGPEDGAGSVFSKAAAAHPELKETFRTTQFDGDHLDFAAPDSVDVVLTFRNLHNWMEAGNAEQMLAAIHRALKPGGIFGVVDHRGHANAPQDPRDTANWPKGVWTLPPMFALRDKDHTKYAAIGEGDNFVLKFQKIDR